MGFLTADEHAEHRAQAIELIDSGRVCTWRQLGIAFGISPQAAQMRFGRGYGLTMPPRVAQPRRSVSVFLDPGLDARLEKARRRSRKATGRVSRAQVVRALLEEYLPA